MDNNLRKKHSVSPDLIAQIPFITNAPRDGRTLILLPFFSHDTKEWVQYLIKDEQLLPVRVIDLVQGVYISSSPVDALGDYYYFLATFVFQHLSFPLVAQRLLEFDKTVHYFASWLETYRRLSTSSSRGPESLLVEAELDHLLILIRRFYDQVQKTIKAASALVRDVKNMSRLLIKNLPDSFADMVEHNDKRLTSEEISNKWGLPKPIANLYVAEADHFMLIRSVRVSLEHHGKSLGIIFNHPEGYAVAISDYPWQKLPIWNESNTRPNGLGSVTAIAAYLISNVLDLGSRFVKAYWSCIGTPRAIAEGVHCYLRNPYSHHLNELASMMAEPWEATSRLSKSLDLINKF